MHRGFLSGKKDTGTHVQRFLGGGSSIAMKLDMLIKTTFLLTKNVLGLRSGAFRKENLLYINQSVHFKRSCGEKIKNDTCE
jgi:hypothetical protein